MSRERKDAAVNMVNPGCLFHSQCLPCAPEVDPFLSSKHRVLGFLKVVWDGG